MRSFEMEAGIKAYNEPQFLECLESVRNQTKPFNKISLVNGVCPEYKARNQLIEKLSCKWVMDIGGDFILYPEAVETAIYWMRKLLTTNVYEFNFGLFDPFLQKNICCCSVAMVNVLKTFRFKDTISNDSECAKIINLSTKFKRIKLSKQVALGTHGQDSTDDQIFRRFYIRGVKSRRNRNTRNRREHISLFNDLWAKTRNPQYPLAKKSLNLGWRLAYYPTSHNIEFDQELFELAKRSNFEIGSTLRKFADIE